MESPLADPKNPVLGQVPYPLQDSAVYGPIHSRRLGFSLGINILPTVYKFCNFNCVYCQYGWTSREGIDEFKSAGKLKSAAELMDKIERSFQQCVAEKKRVDVITIAGNGEPTLHPEFPEIVEGLLKLRDQYLPKRPLCILSNSSQCHRPAVNAALRRLDECYMKLDAGDVDTAASINQPRGKFDLKKTIDALKKLSDVTIQSMFVEGSRNNTKSEQINHWVRAIGEIAPKAVQIYTIDRPPADEDIDEVSTKKLHRIAKRCQEKTGIVTEVFDKKIKI